MFTKKRTTKISSLTRALLGLGVGVVFLCGGVSVAHAAQLHIAPISGTFSVGDEFFVEMYVNSNIQAMNAVSSALSFSTDLLELVSLSKEPTIFTLFVQEPTTSNFAGSVAFEGIVLNPGFLGNHGRLVTVIFRAKAPGNAFVKYVSGSVLANDGLGTNILDGFNNAIYIIKEAPEEEVKPLPPPVQEVVEEPEEVTEATTTSATIDRGISVISPLRVNASSGDISYNNSSWCWLPWIIVFILCILLWLCYRSHRILKEKIQEDTVSAIRATKKAFKLLKEDTTKSIKAIELVRSKRALTAEEEKIIKHFKVELSDAEKSIEEEFAHIESHVKEKPNNRGFFNFLD